VIELKQRMPNCVTYGEELKVYQFNTNEALLDFLEHPTNDSFLFGFLTNQILLSLILLNEKVVKTF
jgi:hypothetical protein